MSVIPIRSEGFSRGARMLCTALGSAVAIWLEDASIIEVMLNPDGKLWVDRLGEGITDTGDTMSAADGERIIRLVTIMSARKSMAPTPVSPPNSRKRANVSKT